MSNQKNLEETYKRYLKGDIIDRKLAYHTVFETIINDLKTKFDEFIKELKKDFEEKYKLLSE